MAEFIHTLSHATERDVDLLLVEELKCSDAFAAWLLKRVGLAAPDSGSVKVLHSTRRMFNRREIDIHVEVPRSVGPPIAVLIENKLDAAEQPGQGVSYVEEKATLVREGRAASARTVLLCPSGYAINARTFASQFDSTITYEDIAAYFSKRAGSQRGEIRQRLEHRAALMLQAVDKSRRGYKPVLVDRIASFNVQYVALLARLAPTVFPGPGLSKGTDKPSDSVSMIFDCTKSFLPLPTELRPTRFAHELGRGKTSRANYVNAQFRGWNRGIGKLAPKFMKRLTDAGIEPEVWIDRRTGRGGVRFRVGTPAVDNQSQFDVVEPLLVTGINALVALRTWILSNRDLLGQLSALSR